MEKLAEFSFTSEQFLLLTLKSGVPLKGVDYNPIKEMSENELKSAWETQSEELRRKNYIGRESEQSLEVDVQLLRILTICQNAKEIYLFQMTKQSEAQKRMSLYFGEDVYVAIEISGALDQSMVEIFLYQQVPEFFEAIKENLDISQFLSPLNEDVTISLSRPQYYRFMSSLNMKKPEKAVEIVEKNGISEFYAIDAVLGFYEKNYFAAFSHIVDDQMTEQIMFYQGKDFLWGIVTSDDEEAVLQLSAISLADCFDSISLLLKLPTVEAV